MKLKYYIAVLLSLYNEHYCYCSLSNIQDDFQKTKAQTQETQETIEISIMNNSDLLRHVSDYIVEISNQIGDTPTRVEFFGNLKDLENGGLKYKALSTYRQGVYDICRLLPQTSNVTHIDLSNTDIGPNFGFKGKQRQVATMIKDLKNKKGEKVDITFSSNPLSVKNTLLHHKNNEQKNNKQNYKRKRDLEKDDSTGSQTTRFFIADTNRLEAHNPEKQQISQNISVNQDEPKSKRSRLTVIKSYDETEDETKINQIENSNQSALNNDVILDSDISRQDDQTSNTDSNYMCLD